MKKSIILMALFLSAVFVNMPAANATGLFYTQATYPVIATGACADTKNLKQGSSKSTNILYLFETGDAGIDAATRDGNISKIHFVDITEKSVFIFFRSLTTTVYGE